MAVRILRQRILNLTKFEGYEFSTTMSTETVYKHETYLSAIICHLKRRIFGFTKNLLTERVTQKLYNSCNGTLDIGCKSTDAVNFAQRLTEAVLTRNEREVRRISLCYSLALRNLMRRIFGLIKFVDRAHNLETLRNGFFYRSFIGHDEERSMENFALRNLRRRILGLANLLAERVTQKPCSSYNGTLDTGYKRAEAVNFAQQLLQKLYLTGRRHKHVEFLSQELETKNLLTERVN